MDRRRFVAALAGAGATAGLAGCSNPLSDGSTPERDAQNEVMDGLYTAVGELNTAALALRTVSSDIENPAEVEFDESGPLGRVETARSALDAAEEADSGPFGAEIEQGRTYATAIESMVETFGPLLDGAAALSSLDGEFDPDNLGNVQTTLEDSRDPLEAAVSTGDEAESAMESADPETLRDLDAEVDRVSDALDDLVGFAGGFDALSRGYQQLVDGVDDVDAAQARFDEEAYDDSQSAFEDGRGHFRNSRDTFESGDEGSPERLDERFGRAIDRSESLNALAGGYATMLGGLSDLETGQQQFENDEYGAARNSFGSASAAFDEASAAFDVKPAPEGEFDARFETAQCRASHLVDAAGSFEEAADAADDGNLVRARNQKEQGEQQLEASRNC